MLALAAHFFLAATGGYANSDDPYAGKYEVLANPQPTSTTDKVEVIEFFWYGCPHCYYFSPFLETWKVTKKPDYVELIIMPTVWKNDAWAPSAKAFYTAKALGVLEKIHTPLFRAIHYARGKRDLSFIKENAFQQFVAKYGVSQSDFRKKYHSFFVDTEVRHAKKMTKDYDIQGVPVIYVNGKYRLTANGYEEQIKVLNHLIEKERQNMGLSSQPTKEITSEENTSK